MKYQILIIQEAEDDILELYKYILKNDSRERATYIYEMLQEKIESLTEFPERGQVPPKLERIDVSGFLEIHFEPYKIIYEIDGRKIFVHAVLDGRRDLQSLLERRMLR